MNLEAGRQHLSPKILQTVDSYRSGIAYPDMQLGQLLTIHAEDAATKKLGSFTIEVVSVRKLDEKRDNWTATLKFKHGEFNFYNGDNTAGRPVRLEGDQLMENGISGTFIPQTDLRMSYYGGIGLGRDHGFEYVDGRDRSVIVHRLTAIDVAAPPPEWQSPDLTEHFRKMEEVKAKQQREREEAMQNSNRSVDAFLEEKFKNHPQYAQIQERVNQFSPNGRIVIASYLGYALEDGVFDKAWQILEKAWDDQYYFQHPQVRGDIDILGQNREQLMEIIREAGIKWPRPGQETPKFEDMEAITLGDDAELRGKLERKLAEYIERFKWTNSDHVRNARHKAMVLQTVLKRSAVTVTELKNLLSKESWFDQDDFETAVWVINEYCSTGGRGRVSGGTGLS